MKPISVILLSLVLLAGLSCSQPKEPKTQVLVQLSTIDALLQGVYDGTASLGQLSKYGNFGIGTFDRLDGEMVLSDGIFYQVRADGKVYRPDTSLTTPFASVTFFENEFTYPADSLDYAAFRLLADSLLPSKNLFCAIRLEGKFSYVKTRSVPAQSKPYPPLAEVTKNQPVFESGEVSGVVSGFYAPGFVKGVNVPGYHLHFLSDKKDFGGHLLDFRLVSGKLALDPVSRFEMILPTKGDFHKSDFSTDRSAELKQAEQ